MAQSPRAFRSRSEQRLWVGCGPATQLLNLSSRRPFPSLTGESRTMGKYRIGVVGHTGRGNYGHGLDQVWRNMPDCKIVGVADADEMAWRGPSSDSAPRGFRDYRQLMDERSPTSWPSDRVGSINTAKWSWRRPSGASISTWKNPCVAPGGSRCHGRRMREEPCQTGHRAPDPL